MGMGESATARICRHWLTIYHPLQKDFKTEVLKWNWEVGSDCSLIFFSKELTGDQTTIWVLRYMVID